MKFFPSFSFLSSFSSFFALIFFYFLLYSPSYDGSGRNNVRLDLYLDKETCDLTCVWTKWLVTWLDLTSDQMTRDLTWTCTEMTCDLTWTCKEMTCDLTWTCKKWLAAISVYQLLVIILCGMTSQNTTIRCYAPVAMWLLLCDCRLLQGFQYSEQYEIRIIINNYKDTLTVLIFPIQ